MCGGKWKREEYKIIREVDQTNLEGRTNRKIIYTNKITITDTYNILINTYNTKKIVRMDPGGNTNKPPNP